MLNDEQSVLDLLIDCRREAGVPRVGCAEWEVAHFCGGARALAELTRLRMAGAVKRGGGFAWVTEDAYASG